MAQAIICNQTGRALIFTTENTLGDSTAESEVIYRLSGEDKLPIELPDIHTEMYFQRIDSALGSDLEQRILTENFPFESLYQELKMIQCRQRAYMHIRMCIDGDVSLGTRLELCAEIRGEFEGEKEKGGMVLRMFHEKIPFLQRVNFEGLPGDGCLGQIFKALKCMMAV